jgi:hypothetical protein
MPSRDHPQIPKEQYALEHPEFILKEHNVGVSGPLTCQLRTDSVTAKLLGESQDTPVEVVVCDKTNHDHPVLLRLSSDKGKLPRLLEGYNEEEVRSALGIESTRIAKRCIREAGTVGADGTFLESPGVILHREYKQDLQSVVEAASDVFAAEHGISGYSPLSGERGLITYSSGGSTAKAGANAASLAKMRIEDELVTIPGMPTVDRGLNKHLLDHCVRSTVLAVFLPGHILRNAMTVYKKHVGEHDLCQLASGFAEWAEESVNADAMYFMGYHVVSQTRINNPRYPFLRRDAKFEAPMNEWTTFKDRVHLEFELRPVVTHQRYTEVRGVERRGFRVKDDKEYKLFCAFGAGEDLFAKPIGDVHQEYIDKYIIPSVSEAVATASAQEDGELAQLGEAQEPEEDDQAPFPAGVDEEGGEGASLGGAPGGGEGTDNGQGQVVDFQPSKLLEHSSMSAGVSCRNSPIGCLRAGTKTKFEITHAGMIDLGVHVSVAAFHRVLGDCINEEGRAQPLDRETGLSMVVRQHAAPHPIRAYDPPSLRLKGRFKFDPDLQSYRDLPRVSRRMGAARGDRRIRYMPGKKADESVMVETLRQAVLGRVLADVTAAEAWSDWMKSSGHSTNTFAQRPAPSTSEDELFLQFLKESVADSASGSLSRWISGQHANQIPDDLKTFAGFESFWRGVQGDLKQFVESLRDGAKRTRKDFRRGLTDLLDRHVPFRRRKCTSVRGHCEFLAQQIMLDLEEVWCDPFGEMAGAEEIVFGPGSKSCMANMGAEAPTAMAQELIGILEAWTSDDLDDDYLAAIGLERDGSVVRVSDWGRPVRYPDGEHLGCKTNIVMRRVHCSRGSSKKPYFTFAHCHPIALRGGVEPWDSNTLQGIARRAIEAFGRIQVAIPKSCRLAYERKEEREKPVEENEVEVVNV